ncbi:MAG: hypothetical protein QMD22_04170 [archaeon]|nr:hypothetical protein [archaeon]
MKNKKLLFGILAVAIVAIAGLSLFYYLNSGEFTMAWKLPSIQEREDWQPAVDKTKDEIIVDIEAGPMAKECFNRSYMTETADYIIEGIIEEAGDGYSYSVHMIITDYIKGKPLQTNKIQINAAVGSPLTFHKGERVRIYLKDSKE